MTTVISQRQTADGVVVAMVVAVGIVMLAGGIFSLRTQRRRHVNAPASTKLEDAATAWLFTTSGLCLMDFALLPGSSSNAVSCGLLLVSAPIWLSSRILREVERHRNRRLRADIGLPTPRRRLHWGLAVLFWAVAVPAAYLLLTDGLVKLGALQVAVRLVQPPISTVVLGPTWFGGAVLVGLVQAWRCRVRARDIEDADLEAVALERVRDDRPPTWLPNAAGRWYVWWQRSLDEPVAIGKEREVIALAIVFNAALLFITGYFILSVSTAALPSPTESRLLGAIFFGVSGLLALAAMAPETMKGLRTALLRRRSRPPQT